MKGLIMVIAVLPTMAYADEQKTVVTAAMDKCALAAADMGRAVGSQTGPMRLTCMVSNGWRLWECITSYPGEVTKSQSWSMSTVEGCYVNGGTVAACKLVDSGGALKVYLAGRNGYGLAQLRLDVDVGKGIGAKVCSGVFAVASSPK